MSTSTQSLQQIREAMANTNDLFNTEVFGKRNFDALDNIYTVNARILPPGAPLIEGRAAIKEFWSKMIPSVNATSAVLESVDVMPAGDSVIEIGRAVLTVEPEGQAASQMEVNTWCTGSWKTAAGSGTSISGIRIPEIDDPLSSYLWLEWIVQFRSRRCESGYPSSRVVCERVGKHEPRPRTPDSRNPLLQNLQYTLFPQRIKSALL
jgi:ketosteroid isomerase-like protein